MKAKFRPDKSPLGQIKNLDYLMQQEFIYHYNKILHKGWFSSWQLKFTVTQLKRGCIRKAIRLTNEEYFVGKSREYLIDNFHEEMHQYCPWNDENSHSPGSVCEGSFCDEAYENWLEAKVK
ncbi:hypothetical protein SDC9_185126 [bioreactor metagenome]|uniref:Uncharacterized protein n=1 Tax=bioreactor metagenome TaxID=1076179 RepID=A0A645HGA9_9ZZZZ